MAVGERDRRELQEALVDTIGPERTDTLFGYLPPTGWEDVPTKTELNARLAAIDSRLDGLQTALQAQIRQLQWMVGVLVVLVAAVLGAGLTR